MDSWQVAQNYLVAAAIGGAVGGYYYYTAKKPNRTGSLNAITSRRSETDLRGRNARRNTLEGRSANATPDSRHSSAARKRKPRAETQIKHQPSLEVIADDKPAKESDMSAAQFANQMQQARQGTKLQTTSRKDARVKTVKPRAAADVVFEGEEEHTHNPTTGDVSDMLEPVAPPPATLRITAPLEPQRTKAPRQTEEEVVETKKQRQNRKKVEERRALREEEEKERKALEERQRRAAREARGEPAKNGVRAAQAPVNSPWEQTNGTTTAAVAQPSDANATQAVMLDTFDAESTSSSNGGPGASTAATSTTSGEQHGYEASSEEEQMAAAIQQSNDESGWTTVSTVAKKTKKPGLPSAAAGPVKESGNGSARSGAYAALGNAD